MGKRGRGREHDLDLSLLAMSDEQAQAAQESLELRSGMRCAGCGRRVGIGFRFTSIDPRDAKAPVIRVAACNREDCDFAEQARDGATVMELVEFVWVDANGLYAPAAGAVVRRNEARAARETPTADNGR